MDWVPAAAATVYVIAQIGGNVLDRLASREIGSPYTDLAAIALVVPAGLALLRMQHAANRASGDPHGDGNRRLTAANYAWIVLGALLWLLLAFSLVATYAL